MQSPSRPRGSRPRVWYFFSDDLPDGEILVPIKCPEGLACAIRPGSMTPEMVDQLNKTADWILGLGIAHLDVGDEDDPPEGKE